MSTSLKAAIIGLLFTGMAYSQIKPPKIHQCIQALPSWMLWAFMPENLLHQSSFPAPGNNSDADFCASKAIA